MRVAIMLLLLSIQSGSAEVRPSVLAGSWYPGRADELRRNVESCLRQAAQKPDLSLVALIIPHAGYQYSARTAAYGYGRVPKDRFQKVMILSPSHQAWIRGAAIGPFDAYETPLGTVSVDRATCDALLQDPLVSEHREAEAREHAIEIHLPFLQVVLGEFSLVPVLVGDLTPDERRALATTLARHVDDETLIVVSSDFTHYGDRFQYTPFAASSVADLQQKLAAMNHEAADLIRRRDVTGFDAYVQRTHDTICGRGSISVLLEMLGPEVHGELINYSTSLDVMPDTESSVSYLTIGFSRSSSADSAEPRGGFLLPEDDKRALVLLAREVVKRHARGEKGPDLEEWKRRMSPAVRQPAGVFVTLMARGDLRGCIGYIEGLKPLAEAVADNALSAAFRDPRFDPVNKAEYSELSFKVSVLTPLEPVHDIGEIEVGRHGLVLSAQGRRGVFLPEVPVEQEWDLPTYLQQLGRKAGLDRDAWKRATLEKFESIVFGDELLTEAEKR
ncbi:AmmeMemoRadiSam system protein B [Candidatus Fermentibacteria bacterium]|nr:AmmeMemoRadiSam system protein B [Candidatus Fermentibacteria bacterium]